MGISRPTKSPGLVVYSCCVLIGPERLQVNGRAVVRRRGELLPGDEPAPLSQRDQLPDPVAVPSDSERLPALDGIHDLPCPVPQVAGSDLLLRTHKDSLARSATACSRSERVLTLAYFGGAAVSAAQCSLDIALVVQ